MKKYLCILILLFLRFDIISGQSPQTIINQVAEHWFDLHNHFQTTSDIWGNYTLDLTLESLLYYDYRRKSNQYITIVNHVMQKRNIEPQDTIAYGSQPFCSIHFALGQVTGNKAWFNGFIAETYKMLHKVKRSPEGAILLNHQNGHYILIDYLQEYASRLAKTGHLTKDTLLYSECVNQFMIYEKLLCNPETGLWSQGRGWLKDPQKLSPGAWSRGHGWLLRGLVTSMLILPECYRDKLLPLLHRTSDALMNVQDKNGMWHILLHLPFDQSEPDISGTGMIAYYLALSHENNWLNESHFKSQLLTSTASLEKYVNDKGEIFNSCKGPGPLREIESYRDYIPEKDEKHGFQAVIYGMMAEMILTGKKNK